MTRTARVGDDTNRKKCPVAVVVIPQPCMVRNDLDRRFRVHLAPLSATESGWHHSGQSVFGGKGLKGQRLVGSRQYRLGHTPANIPMATVRQAVAVWAAPHFLVHLEWEFVKRHLIHLKSHMRTRVLLILSSQDELNSFGVAYSNELCGRTAL